MDFNSSVQSIGWFRDRYREGNLTITPPYQRKPVWATRQKCYLIESILLGLPIPEIYIQQTTTPDGITQYAIVDGQQRIRTVLQFVGAEEDPDEQQFNKFILDKLDSSSPWKDYTFADIPDDAKKRFYGYNFAVRYLNTDSSEDVRDMFKRLNKFLTPLNSQELRHATYSGPFVQLVDKLADDEYWVENRIVSTALIRRMRDVEFVSELVIGVLHGTQGGSSKIIDEYYETYEDYEDEFPAERKTKKIFDETLNLIKNSLPDIKDTRWSNRTDFYTLFICIASFLPEHQFSKSKFAAFRKALDIFEEEVDRGLSDVKANITKEALDYVRSVEKGVNDKRRRGNRHIALTGILEPYFSLRKSKK